MTDDWHKAFQAQRAGRSALLTNKQREDLKKPYVDASDRDAARAAERYKDKAKQAAKAQEVKRFIDEAFGLPNEMDLEASLARPGPVSGPTARAEALAHDPAATSAEPDRRSGSTQASEQSPVRAPRRRGRPTGDAEHHLKEIETVLRVAVREYPPSAGSWPSFGKMAEHLLTLPAVQATRYGKESIEKILRGALPKMRELKITSPYQPKITSPHQSRV
jgi:hypothetical protein